MPLEAVGIGWYRRKDYPRLMEMFTDSWELPDTFDAWVESAQKGYDQLKSSGLPVERVYIDPDTFAQWCQARGLKMNTHARTTYVAAAAQNKHQAIDISGGRKPATR